MCLSCGGSCGGGESYRVMQTWDGNSPYIGCCDVTSGYYCIWDDVAMGLACEEWVELCDFRNILRQVAHISFQVVSERDRARTALNNVARAPPFGMCKRFALGKSYVNISCSTYAEILQRILGALDFKDRESEKEMKYSVNMNQDDKGQTARRSFSIDDASVAFRKGLMTLANELCKRNETYTRWSFEEKYNLKWCIGPCPLNDISDNVPGKPKPPQAPDNTYNDFMKALTAQGKHPADFDVFTEEVMKTNEFKCKADHERLGPSMASKKIDKSVRIVYIFTSGEYAQCGEDDVTGYWYDTKTKILHGPEVLTVNGIDLDLEEMMDRDFLRIKAIFDKRKRFPNSKLKKSESTVSDSSYDELKD